MITHAKEPHIDAHFVKCEHVCTHHIARKVEKNAKVLRCAIFFDSHNPFYMFRKVIKDNKTTMKKIASPVTCCCGRFRIYFFAVQIYLFFAGYCAINVGFFFVCCCCRIEITNAQLEFRVRAKRKHTLKN